MRMNPSGIRRKAGKRLSAVANQTPQTTALPPAPSAAAALAKFSRHLQVSGLWRSFGISVLLFAKRQTSGGAIYNKGIININLLVRPHS